MKARPCETFQRRRSLTFLKLFLKFHRKYFTNEGQCWTILIGSTILRLKILLTYVTHDYLIITDTIQYIELSYPMSGETILPSSLINFLYYTIQLLRIIILITKIKIKYRF